MLLAPEVRSRLERLALAPRGRVQALWSGGHASVRKGESLDFADYRPYVPGDDFRKIDHNLWARLGQVLIRQYEAEEELPLRLAIDSSASMSLHRKHETALELAAMVAYLTLSGRDRVQPVSVPGPGGRMIAVGPSGRHVSAWPDIERWLESLEPAGRAPLSPAIRSLVGGSPTRGPVVLISDLFDDEWERALDSLFVGAGGLVLHVLAREELSPEFAGDLRLRDIEMGSVVDISTSAHVINGYRASLDEFVAGAANRARRAGLDYLLVEAGADAVEMALRALLSAGVVR
jgi:uncharacterized protein (DUF58 family)